MLVVVVVVVVVLSLPSSRVVSCLLCPALSQSVTHTHAHAHAQRGRKQEEKQTQPVTPVKKVDQAPDMQDAFRRLRVHELDGSPLRRSNHGGSSFSNYSNGPVEAARLTPSLALLVLVHTLASLTVGQKRRQSTGERRWASSLRPG